MINLNTQDCFNEIRFETSDFNIESIIKKYTKKEFEATGKIGNILPFKNELEKLLKKRIADSPIREGQSVKDTIRNVQKALDLLNANLIEDYVSQLIAKDNQDESDGN